MSGKVAESGKIRPELNGILRNKKEFLKNPAAEDPKSKCVKPMGLCRVQDKLMEPAFWSRAMQLRVMDTGDRWFYWTAACVLVLLGGSTAATALTSDDASWLAFGIMLTTVDVCALLVGACVVMARSEASLFQYRVHIPIISEDGKSIVWDYYISSALPSADVEALAMEGAGKMGRFAARAAYRYQGALSVEQARIKCKDAIEFFVAQFKTPVTRSTSKSGVENADRLTAAVSQVDEATAMYKTAQSVLEANGITRERLEEIVASAGNKYPQVDERWKGNARRVLVSRVKIPKGEPNDIPSDPEWFVQAGVALETSVPRIDSANGSWDDALKTMRTLGDKLKSTAIGMRLLEDPRYAGAVNEALVAIPTSGAATDALRAYRKMSSDDVVRVDAIINVASIIMDNTILPSQRGGANRIDAITIAFNAGSIPPAILWVGLGLKYMYDNGYVGNLIELIGNDDDWTETAEKSQEILKIAVVVLVVLAVYYQFKTTTMKWSVDTAAREQLLERLGGNLRDIAKLGAKGVETNQIEFMALMKDIELVMSYEILADKQAYAYSPVRISSLVVGVATIAGALVCLWMLWRGIKPLQRINRMDANAAKPMSGGGPMSAAGALVGGMSREEIADFDSDENMELPTPMKAIMCVAALISVVYYIVMMIMTEEKTKSLYANERLMENRNYNT
jgi:hypothetical protein